MPEHNPENVETILGDLPGLQQVALRPWAQNPLLSVVLSQAQALQEVATWAANAHALAQQPPVQENAADDAAEAAVEMPAEPTPVAAGRSNGRKGEG